jgi:hypothetical protein
LVLSTLVCDNGSGKITEDPRARGLDGVDVLRTKEHVDNTVTALGVVEKYKQGPVKEPRALLKLLKRRGEVLDYAFVSIAYLR